MSQPLKRGFSWLTMALCAIQGFAAAAESARTEGDISAPASYKDLMLVLTTAEGAAAVIFTVERERGVSYRFRYQSKDGTKHATGAGQVFERYKEGVYDGGELFINAGPIKIGWSHHDPGKGWVYYNPDKVRVHLAHADNFEGGKPGFGGHVAEKLDLTRFMK